MDILKKYKGSEYEIQIQEYLTINYLDYQSYLWENIPFKYIIKYVFDDLKKYDIENIDNNNIISTVDIGCDIFMVNKNNDDDVIIVQCKNYKDKKVCIEDLSGFFHLIALSHLPVKGLIVSNSNICNRIINKLSLIDKVKFLNIPYKEKIIIQQENIIIPRDYQLEAVDKFKNLDKGILQLFCGMGKTYTSILIAKEFKNIIIMSPLRSYASQLLGVFSNNLKNYSSNLISSDGNRNIIEILNNKKENNIYSVTFCSADIILELINHLDNIILIVDEFHNLSYNNITNNENVINKILKTDKINKKLFMSATPKVYEIKKEDDIVEHSVLDYKNIFGDIFYSYDFKKAIVNKYINEYQVVIPNDEKEKNKYEFIYSNMLYHGYKKCLIYCQNIEEAEKFVNELETINKLKYNFKIYLKSITYKTSLNKRNKILNEFIKEEYKLSFIVSVHTLDECIDIPKCDSVYITYNVKNSINIIQRISRCLRIYPNKIKSGIFLWCEKYNELKKINNIIKNYDINILNNVHIKNGNDKNKILELKNVLSEKDIVEINNTNKLINLLKNNIDNEFINTFFINFKIDGEQNFNIKDIDVSKYLEIKLSTLRYRLQNKYSKSKKFIDNIDYIKKKTGKTSSVSYMLNFKCFEKIIISGDSKNSEIAREHLSNIREILFKNKIFL